MIDDSGLLRTINRGLNVLRLFQGRHDLIPTDSQGRFRLEAIVPNRSTEIQVLSLPYHVTGNFWQACSRSLPGEE